MGEAYWADEDVTLYLGKCEDVLPDLPAESVDAIVTDPPYELTAGKKGGTGKASLNVNSPAGRSRISTGGGGFMGRSWDATGVPFDPETWRAAYRVLKPGGHLLAFGGTRTWHRLVCAIEDAGFEIRDSIDWIYGQGFAKSRDVSKDIDKAAGAEREVVGEGQRFGRGSMRNRSRVEMGYRPTEINPEGGTAQITAPATEDAARWEGWGTALKPAHEPIVVARKPLAGTVAGNVLEWGTGALNVDACRVEGPAGSGHWIRNGEMGTRGIYGQGGQAGEDFGGENPAGGRWPPNILLTHSADCQPIGTRRVRANGDGGGMARSGYEGGDRRPGKGHADADGMETVEAWECAPDCPVAELDRQSGVSSERARVLNRNGARQMDGWGLAAQSQGIVHGDKGGASRFFPVFRYQAKAPTSERPRLEDGSAHETVKPLGLVRWLVRLVTPPGGTVADMFAGSGPTAEACIVEGFRCILIEQDPKSAELIRKRLSKPIQPLMFGMEDSAPAAPARRVAASRPKPQPEAHPSLFDLDESA